jgi:hypothetical protein
VKRIRIVALIAGLATDIVGTILYSIALCVVFVVRHAHIGERPEVIVQKLTSDVPFMLVGYLGGIGFTFLGAYVTAKLSRPNSVFNAFIFGLIGTLAGFLFISINPLWYTILCELTILPVSLIPGYLLQRKAV